MLIISLMSGIFRSYAATNTWTQTNWSGGVGTDPATQFESQTNIDFSTSGEITGMMGEDWYDNDWQYRKTITIDAANVSGSQDLLNFPVYIDSTEDELRSVAQGGRVEQSDGGDILFTDADGNKLAHSIETYTANSGHLQAWVRIPVLAYNTDTIIYMYYGNDAGGLDESDQTGNIYTAFDLDGVDDYIEIPHAAEFDFEYTQPFSISTWVQPNNTAATMRFVGKLDDVNSGDTGWSLYQGLGQVSFIMQHGTTTQRLIVRAGGALPTDRPSFVTVTYNGSGDASGVKIYINGSERSNVVASNTLTAGSGTTIRNSSPLRIGAELGNFYLDGKIGESVIYNKVLSSAEVIQIFNNNQPRHEESEGLVTSIIGMWRAQGSTVGVGNVPDLVGTSNGTMQGGLSENDIVYSYPAAAPAGSVNFNGTNQYVNVFSNETVPSDFQSIGNNFGASFFFQQDATGNSSATWVSSRTILELRSIAGTSTKVPFSIGLDNSGVGASVRLGVTDNYITTPERVHSTTYSNNDWKHAVVNISGNDWEIWLDGVKTSGTFVVATGNRNVGTSLSSLTIGARRTDANALANYFDGRLSNLTVRNSPYSSAEVEMLYNRGSAENDSGVSGNILEYRMGGNDNLTVSQGVIDSAGNFNATAVNMTTQTFFPGQYSFNSGGYATAGWNTTVENNRNDPDNFYSFSDDLLSADLVSAPFDTGDPNSSIGDISWTAITPEVSEVLFQIRTAPDNAGTPGTWSDWLGPTDVNDFYTLSDGDNPINPIHTDGIDDQWVQYRLEMNFIAGEAPTIEDISLVYVANNPPEFNPDYPSTGAGGVIGTMNTDGTVTIEYSIRDVDTSTGSVTPGFITPSFEYSLDGGSAWNAITPESLGVDDLNNKSVEQSSYTIHAATWNVRDAIADTYTTQAQVRVSADDNEGANNSFQMASNNFIIDTAAPVIGNVSIDASVDPADLLISCSDDVSMEMRIGLESDLSDGVYIPYAPTAVFEEDVEGGDQVYVQCRDLYGNESTIKTIDIPSTPTNLFYQDISDTPNDSYRLFIAWSVIAEPNAGFASYNIYRSTDGSNFSLIETITNRSTNYLIDTGLSAGLTYYYRLTASDDDGNISSFSMEVSDEPDGAGGTDLSPPIISNISTQDISASGITITWESNELSNSTVYYQPTSVSPGSSPASYASSQGVPSMVTEHSVSLASLEPGTQYYYVVTSTDPSGNTGGSSTSGTFTTAFGPVISSVSASEVFNDQATITWNTDAPADSRVFYSINSDLSSASQLGSSDLVTNHSIVIPNLTSGETYYFYVSSENALGSTTEDRNIVNGIIRYYSFSTTSDSVAPIITNVRTALIGETGATVAWTTNEGATSQIEWGSTPNLGTFTAQSTVYTTQHAVTLTGLENTSQYYYRVISEDRAGNESQNNNSNTQYSFTTLAPSEIVVTRTEINNIFVNSDTTRPTISNIQVIPLTTRTARVSFQTDKVTKSEVSYGSLNNTNRTAGDTSKYSFEHNIILDGLTIGTTYSYSIRSTDTSNNITQSELRTFIHQEPAQTQELILSDATRDLLRSIAQSENINLSDPAIQKALGEISILGFGSGDGSGSGLAPGEFGIVNPQFKNIGSNDATLIWRTTRPARTVIDVVNLGDNFITSYTDNSYISSHEFKVEGLKERTSYTARITAQDENGNIITSTLLPFSTTINNDPLIITDVRTNATIIPGRSDKVQTIISWKTNKPATSQVLYNKGVVGEILSENSNKSQNYTTNHVMIVSSFDTGTIYRVRAESSDGTGKTVQSEDYSLITPRSQENIIDIIFENAEQIFGFARR